VIDWWNIFTNSVWISGLALALASFGYADWQAWRSDEGIRMTIQITTRSPGFALGLALACLGAGLGVSTWWQRIVWLLLAVGLASAAVWLCQKPWKDASM
jgi:hypothetical protein